MSATASLRYINKENPGVAGCLDGGAVVPAAGAKRRALGDVMNTALANRPFGMTPKSGAGKFISTHTPKLSVRCPVPAVEKEPELPPVERCVPVPNDTFDDIFAEHLRLTDVFFGPAAERQQIKFVGRLPCPTAAAAASSQERIRLDDAYELETEREARKQLKKRNRSLRRKQQPTADAISIFVDAPLDLSPVRELELTESDLDIF